ncbi:MAG: nitroreductase family protein [Hahellaceae bacterium]|nr:nitroreductase family protein [Hahellaceae bacterium]MCP5168998.1 nitroreductase family protein [Hahellaceae bacterium]
MLNTEDAILVRRSIRHYAPEFAIPEHDINKLLQLALHTPTSFNIQHERIVRVTDVAQRERLKAAAWNQEHISTASEVWIICADIQAWQKTPERYWRNVDEPTRSTILPMLDDFYRGKPQLQRDEALRTCGMVAQTVMLAAAAMGYGSCPMIGFDADEVARLINLPEDHLIGMIVTLGKSVQPENPRSGPLAVEEVITHNHF